MYVCMYVCTYVCMYVCMYVRMYVCTYVRMYVCMCIHTYLPLSEVHYVIMEEFQEYDLGDRINLCTVSVHVCRVLRLKVF